MQRSTTEESSYLVNENKSQTVLPQITYEPLLFRKDTTQETLSLSYIPDIARIFVSSYFHIVSSVCKLNTAIFAVKRKIKAV